MQQAAIRRDRTVRPRQGGKLRVVLPTAGARPVEPRRASAEARCRTVFNALVIAMVAVSLLGLARVAVLARATEMALSVGRLTKSIKAQRLETDRLEIDRSSLATPSRIQDIASATMRMGEPGSVAYISLPPGGESLEARAAAAGTASSGGRRAAVGKGPPGGLGAILSALVDVSAGEAQTLLVGDLGLAGSR